MVGDGRSRDRLARRRRLALAVVAALVAGACSPVLELEFGDPIEFVQQPQTSIVYAGDGSVLAELHAGEDRREVSLEDVSQSLIDAVVAIEDRRFFQHRGVDAGAILRAALRNVESGEIVQGGSTITQQYVKNTITGPAPTLERKIREATIAYRLEEQYSKEEILERYLNTVYFGRQAYGVHAAARRFFDKAPADVTIAEAALLAAVLASPSSYDPYDNPEAALERREVVLNAMVSTGAITRAEHIDASNALLNLASPPQADRVTAPYFLDEVKRQIQHDPRGRYAAVGETLDERVTALFTGGLRIYTTIDHVWQTQAEAAVASVLSEPSDPDAALVAIDPVTGGVRAMVGGKDYYDPDDPQARFNLATQGKRQPGSSFKPIVLATALSRGVRLDRLFPGGSSVFLPQCNNWNPSNYGGSSYSSLTLREATVRSVNTVYARLGAELGARTILQTAKTLGIDSDLPQVCSIALGTGEVTPLELTSAYVPFSTNGRARDVHVITRIEDAEGRVLFRQETPGFRVLDEGVAYLINDTLQDVVRRGTGVRAQIGRPQAGKTGTSQSSSDAWFVGYTPDIVAGVWVGFSEGRIPMSPPTTRIRVEGGRWPAEIWKAFVSEALANVDPHEFPEPDISLVGVLVDVSRNCLPNPYTPPELIELRQFPEGAAPTERCTEPTGPPIDDVPSVLGLPEEVAKRLLIDDGFTVDVRLEVSRLYPGGIVTRQRPSPGGSTRPEDAHAVVIWVSVRAAGQAQVPDVVGMTTTRAIATLELENWVADLVESCPSTGCPTNARPGEVWAQSPDAGEIAPEYSAVLLRVYPAIIEPTPTPTESPSATPSPTPTPNPDPSQTP